MPRIVTVERQQNKRNSVATKTPTRPSLELRILILPRAPPREGGITYVGTCVT